MAPPNRARRGEGSGELPRAALAEAADDDLVLIGLEAHAADDPVDRPLQRDVLKGDQPVTAATDRVMMVLSAGIDPLVTGCAAADLEALQQAELLELLERAVDAGAP